MKDDSLIGKHVKVWNQTLSGQPIVEGVAIIRGWELGTQLTDDRIHASVQFPDESECYCRWINRSDIIN